MQFMKVLKSSYVMIAEKHLVKQQNSKDISKQFTKEHKLETFDKTLDQTVHLRKYIAVHENFEKFCIIFSSKQAHKKSLSENNSADYSSSRN